MTKGPIRAVLWDKDGTLIDSFGPWILREKALIRRLYDLYAPPLLPPNILSEILSKSMSLLGIQQTGRVAANGLLACGTEESILLGLHSVLIQSIKIPAPQEFLADARRELSEILRQIPLRPRAIEHTEALVTALYRAQIPQGIATSDTWANTSSEICSLGWEKYFIYQGCSDRSQSPKPHPWMVFEFARLTDTKAAEILVIGDSPADQALALAAGAQFVLVLTGAGERKDFAENCWVVNSVNELQQVLMP